ncbi:unnamed protein product, partial [marine sediment metagenome]
DTFISQPDQANPALAETAVDNLLYGDPYFISQDKRVLLLANLPEHIKERYINDAGDTYLVTIYPREHIWDFEVLRRFNAQLERVSPRITGNPPMFLRLIDYIGRDGLRATILAIFIVIILLWVDFRSLSMALLGVIPLIAGGIW